MDFSYSPKVVDLQKRLTAFMEEHIYPAEAVQLDKLTQFQLHNVS